MCCYCFETKSHYILENSNWPGTQYINQASLKFTNIFLLLTPPKYWDLRHVSSCPTQPFLFVLSCVYVRLYVCMYHMCKCWCIFIWKWEADVSSWVGLRPVSKSLTWIQTLMIWLIYWQAWPRSHLPLLPEQGVPAGPEFLTSIGMGTRECKSGPHSDLVSTLCTESFPQPEFSVLNRNVRWSGLRIPVFQFL